MSFLDGPVPASESPIEHTGGQNHEEPDLARIQRNHDLGIVAEMRSQPIGKGDPQGGEDDVPTHDEEQPGAQEILHGRRNRIFDCGPGNGNQPSCADGHAVSANPRWGVDGQTSSPPAPCAVDSYGTMLGL